MLHQVMRQRRRFAFALLLTQLALFGVVPQSWILALMLLGLIVGFGLVSASGHGARRLIECGAIGVLAATRMPSVILIGLTFFGATLAAYVVLYTPLLDRLPIRIAMRSRKMFVVALDRRTTWYKLIPGQGHIAAYWTGTMTAARKDSHDDATLYLSFDDPYEGQEEVTVTYLDMDPHHKATYLIERDSQLPGEEIIMTYRMLQTEEERTSIYSDMRVSGLPVRLAVERFFDDVLGDELDSFATMTECKRSWSLKDVDDVALTSELGSDDVKLNVEVADPSDEAATRQRQISA